jgi:tetratricopeptide (TPR) repeat protein
MFAAALWMLIRAFRRSSIDIISFGVLGSLLAAHFFQILFVFDNLTSYLLFFAILAYVHVVARSARSPRPRLLPAGVPAAGGVAAAFAVVLLLYFANVKPIMAASDILDTLVIAQTAEPAGRVDTLIAKFEEGIALHTFGTTEMREQVSQIASVVARDSALANQDKIKYLEFAINELEAQRKRFPSDVRAAAFLATLYSTAGRPEDAIRVTEEVLAISPYRQQFYFIEAEAYINLGQNEKAIGVLKKAYDLAPDYPEALVNFGTVLILAGKGDQAEALLQEHYGTKFIADLHYAQAYTQIGDFGKAAEVWKLIVKSSPSSAESHANYGGVLARAGNREEAIREFEEAIRLEPRFEAQGRQIIEQIRNGKIQ